MHFSIGPALIVIFDLLSVFIDSTFFGIIFQRSHNVFVAWIAHFLAACRRENQFSDKNSTIGLNRSLNSAKQA
jgi:hypothetical protein